MHIFGWDIGGAHLKVARLDASGMVDRVHQLACPLWRGVGELARAVRLIEQDLAVADAVHAVTMTGELCDVFTSRTDGVRQILGALGQLLGDGARVRVFGGYAGWLSPVEAIAGGADDVASANWLALAAYVAELVGDGVLVDVGSTTTDIIPFRAGEVCALGRDDASRLAHGELVYTGVVRTPVASLCRQVPFRGRWQPLAAEYFANAADVHRLCNTLADGLDLMETADGAGKDRVASARRLARMVGCDLDHGVAIEEVTALAHYLARCQRESVADALALVTSSAPQTLGNVPVVSAGAGDFLVGAVAASIGRPLRTFASLVHAEPEVAAAATVAAPAVAAARLAWMTR
ncbi:MAG: hydantoinase/oxoprolinase family protein [Gammaproteobacteria bacterium]